MARWKLWDYVNDANVPLGSPIAGRARLKVWDYVNGTWMVESETGTAFKGWDYETGAWSVITRMASATDWIQDEPLEVVRTISGVISSHVAGDFGSAGDAEARAAILMATEQVGTIGSSAGPLWQYLVTGTDYKPDAYQSTQYFDAGAELTGTSYAPTLPPGAFGYENHPDDDPTSIDGPLLLEGTLDTTFGSGIGGKLIRLPAGTTLAEWHTPATLVGATVLQTVGAMTTAAVSETFTLDADGYAKFMIVPDYYINGAGWPVASGGSMDASHSPPSPGRYGLRVTWTYRRARYRFLYAAPGAAGSDSFSGAGVLSIASDGAGVISPAFDNAAATLEGFETAPPYRTAWWRYTPATAGYAVFDATNTTTEGSPDETLIVYTGPDSSSLTQVAIDFWPEARIMYWVEAGETYWIKIGSYYDTDQTYVLMVSGPAT